MTESTIPFILRDRCEGKSACVAVCPNDVFEVERIKDEDYAQLSFLGKLKSSAHRRQTAYVVRPDDCRACGACVPACPEQAIRLVER